MTYTIEVYLRPKKWYRLNDYEVRARNDIGRYVGFSAIGINALTPWYAVGNNPAQLIEQAKKHILKLEVERMKKEKSKPVLVTKVVFVTDGEGNVR